MCDNTSPPFVNGGQIKAHPGKKYDVFNKCFTSVSHIEDEPDLRLEVMNR